MLVCPTVSVPERDCHSICISSGAIISDLQLNTTSGRAMHRNRLLTAVLIGLLVHGEVIVSTAEPVFTLIHDIVQNNIAGVPVTHQKTEWNFDPEIGKQRRVRYEQENGRFGEIAIAKIGMGIGYKGAWGKPVDN